MQQANWRERLRYRFDASMAAGPLALIAWLAGLTVLTILLAAAVIALLGITPEGDGPLSFIEAMWAALMRAMDAGALGGDSGWSFRGVMFVVTMAGIFIFSALIGILSAGIDTRLEELRKGRSRVLERGHTIILNWSPSIFDVLSELVIANASEKAPRVVILANHDKVAMEDELAERLPDRGRLKIICRSGDPKSLFDIAIANPGDAKSIIILSPPDEDADTAVIKSLITLINDPARRTTYNITAEIRDEDNRVIAETIGGAEANVVLADNFIARLIAHSTQSSGLAEVFGELLDFDGCEIYTHRPAGIDADYTFRQALADYRDCIPIGLVREGDAIVLCPAMDAPVGAGAAFLVIAEDDSAIAHSVQAVRPEPVVLPPPAATAIRPARILILGWNQRGSQCVEELARINPPGTLITIASTESDSLAVNRQVLADYGAQLDIRTVDIRHRREIATLDPLANDSIIVLGYADRLSEQAADTVTLLCLLHLRELIRAGGEGGHRPNIISEMADVNNRALAEITKADDFVVSNKMLSLLMAQASENRHVFGVFSELLSHGGADILLRPITDYATAGETVEFGTLQTSAAAYGTVAIGIMRGEEGALPQVNPPKSTPVAIVPDAWLVAIGHAPG